MTDAPVTAAPTGAAVRRALQAARRRPRALVLGWAVVIAAASFSHFLAQGSPTFMGTRMDGISQSIAVLDRGGPPLLGSDVPYRPSLNAKHLFPVGTTDDQGIYLYLPALGHLTGQKNPAVLMRWFFSGCFSLLVFLVPILIFELFGSLLVAFVAPLLVVWRFEGIEGMDIYWILAWCMLLGLPALLLAYRWWRDRLRRRATVLLTALVLAASFATSIRANAGLPIVLDALGIVLLAGTDRWRRPRTWRLGRPTRADLARPTAAVLLVAAYLAVSPFALAQVRDYRNSAINNPSFAAGAATQHPLWHNAYIGLGYLPNRYGIVWSDAVSADLVERTHPGTGFLTPTYEATLRSAYLHILRTDPGLFARNVWAKTRTIVGSAVSKFWLAPILIVVGLFLRRRRRETAVVIALSVPALLIGAASPVLTIPSEEYALGWTGTWGAIWLLAIGWTLVELSAVLAPSRLRALLGALRPRALLAVAGVTVLVAATAATATPTPPPSADDVYSAEATPLGPLPAALGHTVASWRFGGVLPPAWQDVSATLLQADTGGTSRRGLYVRTPTSPDATAVASRPVLLPAGRYRLVGRSRVFAGGLALVVRDAASGDQLGTSRYWWGEGDFLGNPVMTSFSLEAPTRVRISLDNWTPFPNASAFVVWNLSLERLTPPAAYYTPRATPLVPASSLAGAKLRDWPFDGGTPDPWYPPVQIGQTAAPGALKIVTTTERSGYQLETTPFLLGPGRYAVSVDATVQYGGLELGVLDDARDAWIRTERFWSGQHPGPGREMAAVVTLHEPTQVRLILSNWAPTPTASEWTLRRVELLRLP
jgi:hypothetical protein